ncbi:MAG: hypothetical protein L3J45_07895 [Flavobacteriaceae bacterium]|nr:hypothetical protein [Flavobacteriaceae bacterium]
MSRDEKLKEDFKAVKALVAEKFTGGELPDLDAIIYLIGVQELGKGHQKFKKDDNVNLMHIAICRLLEPLGYYEFEFFDADGWPHYKVKEELPFLKPGEQSILMKEAIVFYFKEKGLI